MDNFLIASCDQASLLLVNLIIIKLQLARSSRSSSKLDAELRLENENLQEQLSFMLIKIAEKDNIIHELDSKNRTLEDQLREGESTMRLVSFIN